MTFDQNVKFGAEALLGSSDQKQSTQEGSSIQSKVQTGYSAQDMIHKGLQFTSRQTVRSLQGRGVKVCIIANERLFQCMFSLNPVFVAVFLHRVVIKYHVHQVAMFLCSQIAKTQESINALQKTAVGGCSPKGGVTKQALPYAKTRLVY